MLPTILLTFLTSCSTKVLPSQSDIPLEIPQIVESVEKPILENIPLLDTSQFTRAQNDNIANVLSAMNRNLIRLVGYSIRLGGYADANKEYINAIQEALKNL